MSQVIFNNRINMIFAATPSVGGYTIGYDLDGVIKQKDSAGNVTPLFSSSSENLAQTLQLGNDSGAYSIVMGTATSISSGGAKSYIMLDHGGGIFIYSTASGSTSSVTLANGRSMLRSHITSGSSDADLNGASYSLNVYSATQSMSFKQTNKSIDIFYRDSHAGNSSVSVLNIGSSYDNDLTDNKAYVHINSKNASTLSGVENSVVIGGSGLIASSSDTVYLGNNVNINNEYTLPNTDGSNGQVLMTDGAGQVSWSAASSASNPPLDDVLAVGNNSESYSIVMGTGTSIRSANGQSQVLLDYSSTQNSILISSDGPLKQKSYVQLTESVISIGATSGTVEIGDLKGLVYAADYSATFVNNSLVTKQYVDSISNSVFLTYKIAYVDPVNGSDVTGLVNRVDKPYQTVAKATSGLTSSYVFTSSDQGLVHLKKGLYSAGITMFDNINYYCEPGVLFTGNGFTDLGSTVNSSVMGYADFISSSSTNLVPLDITRASNVTFEFRTIENLMTAFKVTNSTGTSNIKIKGERISTQSRLGRGMLIGNQAGTSDVSSNISIEVRESITGAYDVVDVRPRFSGSVDIKCPSIYCDADINTLTGPQTNAQHVLAIRSASASVSIKGDIYERTSSFVGGNNAAVYVSGCDLKIAGNIDGGNCPGALVEGTVGTFSVEGNIISRRESVINNSNGIAMRVSDSLLRTEGTGTVPYAINVNSGTMSSLHIHNSRIYNSVQDSGIIVMSTTHSAFKIYNSLAYSPGTASGNFIYCAATVSVGIHNTRCNKDNSDLVEDLFAPSGFIYDDRFDMEGF
jgi:hypothetical protein